LRNIGYARVSTEEQNLDLQLRALKAAGCRLIFQDHGMSGALRSRPGLDSALQTLRPGDTLIVWRLDRLGRSLPHLISLIESIGAKDAGFCSLCEHIETTSAGGRLVFHMMGALAEFERALISERTRAGLKAAAARGQKLGRPRKLTPQQIAMARNTDQSKHHTVADKLGVHVTTLRRALKEG
jgi:DNA invertase Pin-like site-specific DNA recombinase